MRVVLSRLGLELGSEGLREILQTVYERSTGCSGWPVILWVANTSCMSY